MQQVNHQIIHLRRELWIHIASNWNMRGEKQQAKIRFTIRVENDKKPKRFKNGVRGI